MFKNKKGLLPIQIAEYFPLAPTQHSQTQYSLRNRNPTTQQIIVHRTNLGEKSIQLRGNIIWNEIPTELKIVDSHIFFKRKYKELLISENSSI